MITQAEAGQIATTAHPGDVVHVEPRYIELLSEEQLVRDVRVWLVFVSVGNRHVEVAVDQASGDIVRVQRAR